MKAKTSYLFKESASNRRVLDEQSVEAGWKFLLRLLCLDKNEKRSLNLPGLMLERESETLKEAMETTYEGMWASGGRIQGQVTLYEPEEYKIAFSIHTKKGRITRTYLWRIYENERGEIIRHLKFIQYSSIHDLIHPIGLIKAIILTPLFVIFAGRILARHANHGRF